MGNFWSCKKETSWKTWWFKCKMCNIKNWGSKTRDNLERLEKFLPILAICAIITVFITLWVTSYKKDENNTETFSNQPLTLPTDSLVGPRVEIQKHPLQVANGGDQTIWIEWVGSSAPFYPEDSTAFGGRAQGVGEQNTSEGRRPKDIAQKGLREAVTAKGGGRIRIDPGQHVFFSVKKTRLEERIRLSPLMGCDDGGCQVGGADGGCVVPRLGFGLHRRHLRRHQRLFLELDPDGGARRADLDGAVLRGGDPAVAALARCGGARRFRPNRRVPRCPETPSDTASASPPGARATGSRSAA